MATSADSSSPVERHSAPLTEEGAAPSSGARVVRLRVTPGAATVLVGAAVDFAATPEDARGTAIAGVKVTWHAIDSASGREVSVPSILDGRFIGDVPGQYLVVALAQQHRA